MWTVQQTIHMKCQALSYPENKFKKIKVSSAAVAINTLRVKIQSRLEADDNTKIDLFFKENKTCNFITSVC